MTAYRHEIAAIMWFTLQMKDRRRYAAVEAMELGAEGVKYVALYSS